jgi:integrase
MKKLLSQINILNSQISKYTTLLKNINFLTNDFKIMNNIKSYEEVINSMFLNPETKNEYISFFKAYEAYINDKNRDEILKSYKEEREPILFNLYYPDNAWDYIMNNNNLNDNTKKQRLKKFINIIRKATGDASLMYSYNYPKSIKTKIKHLITNEEIIKYTNYLKEEGLFESLIIIELLFKFGFRIGAISKIKVKDLSEDNNLILLEKNKELIKRKLFPETANKLRQLIKIQKITRNDFIFFPSKFKQNTNKRAKFFSSYIKQSMIKSNAFPNSDFEDISAHCFRATLAVKKYKSLGVSAAQKALNHKRLSTTMSHYIKENERELNLYEEKNYKNNKMINSAFKWDINSLDDSNNNNKNADYIDSDEYNINSSEEESMEDNNNLFDVNFEKEAKFENKVFLNKKRAMKNLATEYIEKRGSENKYNLFNSILDESLENTKKEETFIINALRDSGRIFTPYIKSSKKSYQYADYAKLTIISEEDNEIFQKEVSDLLIKNSKCIFDYAFVKTKNEKFVLFAKTNIKKNQLICEVTGKLVLGSDIKIKEYENGDPYTQLIPFYQTKNKLRDRILITSKISNIAIFINIVEPNDSKINTTLFLCQDNNKNCHLFFKSIKSIKKGELLYINREEMKLRIN